MAFDIYKIPSSGTVINNFQFEIKNKKKFFGLIDSLQIYSEIAQDNKLHNFWKATFLENEFCLFKNAKCIDSIKKYRFNKIIIS